METISEKPPLVSIIIPNFNHSKYLSERFNSIFFQTFKDYEIIILDDSSTDDSVKILNRFSKSKKVSFLKKNIKNSGSPFKQWLKGIRLAQGKYIWIAESDDSSEVIFLELLIEKMRNSPESTGLIYGQSVDIDEEGNFISNRIEYTSNFKPNLWENNFNMNGRIFIQKYLKVKNVVPNASAVIFRRDLIDDNVFTQDLLKMKMCGDWYFWVKLCLKTDVGFVAQPVNFFRNHPKMSRSHSTRNIKLERLQEEMQIRKYLKEKGFMNQKKEIDDLYTSWFRHFSIYGIFKKEFYDILFSKTSFLRFINKFLISKMHD